MTEENTRKNRIEKAVEVAAQAHPGPLRKGTLHRILRTRCKILGTWVMKANIEISIRLGMWICN